MLAALLDIGGFVFWSVIGVIFLFDYLAVALDDDGFYRGALLLTSVAIVYTVIQVHGSLQDQLLLLSVSALGYFCIGVIWSFKKWHDIIRDKRQKAKADYGDKWRERTNPPKAANYKVAITSWMLLWPWSISWWVLTWPRHAVIWAYNRLSVLFDNIASNAWRQ